ncbi:MAG: TIGR02677 family protein [Microthrixaceae bacterium]|jgi:uncharacterized protein (TIGR02677 family)|nr:TIGR02677 family protein [Microthrixaceae bacterium]
MNEQEIATTDPGGERGRVGTDTTDVADAADATDTTGATGATDAADAGRRLFAYLGGPEWRDYRAIIGVFAGTFFAEFTPDDVSQRLAELGTPLDAALVAERLESLRRWGNLAVSSSVGSPTSLADYYRRRNRYLITSAGQDVYEVVETVLGRVDEVQDVSASRLRSLHDALRALRDLDIANTDPELVADRVREVFGPHDDFTGEITRFFAALNQWQSRYDLSHAELTFFAQVLVTYVAEQLDEIHRVAGPVAVALDELAPRVPEIIARMGRGLAARVDDAGIVGAVVVAHRTGTAAADWEHLRSWFCDGGAGPARLTRLRNDAIAAIRTLTLNLTRLSRIGIGGASRRADLVRLASLIDRSGPVYAPKLAQAAFGLGPTVHWGTPAGDIDDPVAAGTPWAEAPPATVPISLRERGDRAARGHSSPIPDRSLAQRLMRDQRERQRARLRQVEDELTSTDLDGAVVSPAALHRLQSLIGATLARLGPTGDAATHVDGDLRCRVERCAGTSLTISTADGTLTIADLVVTVERSHGGDRSVRPLATADRPQPGIARTADG